MEDILCEIKKTPLFGTFSNEELQELKSCIRLKNYSKGESIFFLGDSSTGFYIVRSGRVKIYRITPNGKEHVHHIAEPGESFSEAACFGGMNYPANAEAVEKTNLVFINNALFLRHLAQKPWLAQKMLASMSMRLRMLTDQVHSLAGQNVEERLASYIIMKLGRKLHDGAVLDIGINKSVLASRLGTTPETLSRTFNKFKKMGIIEVKKKELKLIDSELLLDINL